MKQRVQNKKTNSHFFYENRWFHVIVIVTAASVLVFYNLGKNSFHNGDEALYALIVKGVLRTGNWLTPSIQGEVCYSKPPLLIWLNALSSLTFGFSEFSVRLQAAFFGVLTILFTYLFAEKLFDRWTGILSSFIMLTCTQFIYLHASKTGEFETATVFLVFLPVYLVYNTKHKKISFYLAAAAIGAVAMIKNIIFVMPVGISILYLLMSGRIKDYGIKEWAIAVCIFLLVVVPWHVIQLVIHGKAFVDIYFMDQIVGRRLGTGSLVAFFDPLYYIRVIRDGFFPWSIILPFAIIFNILYINKSVRNQTVLLFIWAFVVFSICNFVKIKYSWYILSIYPALAILCGRFLVDLLRGSTNRILFSFMVTGIIILFVLMMPDLSYNPFAGTAFSNPPKLIYNKSFLSLYHQNHSLTISLIIVVWLLLGLATFFILYRYKKISSSVSNTIASILILSLVVASLLIVILPLRFSDHKSLFDKMGQEIWSEADPETVLVIYGSNLPNYLEYIYLYNRIYPEKDTAAFIGLDDDFLTQEALSAKKRLFFMERQTYYDLRSKEKFNELLSHPIREWKNYVLLEKSRRKQLFNGKKKKITDVYNAFKNSKPEIRRAAAIKVGRLGDFGAAPSLIELLDDPDDRVVSAAAKALGDLRFEAAVNPLKNSLMRYGEDDETYQTIAFSLAYLRDKSATNFLVKKYTENPIFNIKSATVVNSKDYGEFDTFKIANLLLNTNFTVARNVILSNLFGWVNSMQKKGLSLSTSSRPIYLLYRLDNKTTLDLIEHLINENDLLKKKIGTCLLAKPSATIAKLTEKEMDRAQSLLQQLSSDNNQPEISVLAKQILSSYHRDAWVGW